MRLCELPKELNKDQLQELYEMWKRSGEDELMHRIVYGVMRKVYVWTYRYRYKDHDEIFSAAMEGVMKAMKLALSNDVDNILGYVRVRALGEVKNLVLRTVYCRTSNTIPLYEINEPTVEDHHFDPEDFKREYKISDEDFELVKLRSEGLTFKEIGEVVGRHSTRVERRIKKCARI